MNDLQTAAQQALEAMEVATTPLAKDRQEVLRAQAALRAALAQRAEPLNLSDRAVQRRLAAQWGYVPAAAQAEPAQEPVAWNWMLDGQPYGQAYYGRPPDADIAERAATAGRTVRLLYTAPPKAEPVEQLAELQAMLRAEVDRLIAAGIQPQRKLVPLTEAEIEHIGITHQSLRQVARAVEKASWEKNHGQA